MLTWQIDRFLKSGPACAVVTFIVPALLAALIANVTTVDNVLGILLLASLIIFIGSLGGSVIGAGFGTLLFGLGALLAEVSPVILLLSSCALFTNLMIHDLAGSFRRAPGINPSAWKNAAIVSISVSVASVVAFGATYFVATLSTWQSIVVPFGIAAVGLAVKLASDSHLAESVQLTSKRKQPTDT